MDTLLISKFVAAFAFVIGMMFMLQWFMKKIGLAGQSMLPGAKRRLKVIEYLPLDHRRRLLLVRRDDREHLIVLGPNGETVVESGIAAVLEPETATPVMGAQIMKEQKSV